MQFTVKLFWHLYNNLPPLFPEEISAQIKNELDGLLDRPQLSLTEVEDKMVRFGYEVWPWNQAYKYFLYIALANLGEHFLLPQLSLGLQQKYLDFKVYGGSLADLRTGRPAGFFSTEERAELGVKLVGLQSQLKEYVNRELIGVNKKQYLHKVEEYKILLKKMKESLDTLRGLAAAEEESTLGLEINSKIKDFEHGLCFLGTELNYDAVCQAPDFFAGRKLDLNRLRGINVPIEIDFYTN